MVEIVYMIMMMMMMIFVVVEDECEELLFKSNGDVE